MNKFQDNLRKYDLATVVLWLCTLEFIVFAKITRSAGFYLDDWSMLKLLHFGPSDFIAMSKNYLLSWPLIAMRPVQAPFHAAMFTAFGLAPFGYHLTAAVMDVATAALFYLIIRELVQRKDIAIMAASLALIDPRHDTTHAWVLCSSVALSQFLTMLSVWLAVVGAKRQKLLLKLSSMVPFALMAWNYEMFIPMALLNALFLSRGGARLGRLRSFLCWCGYYAMPVVLLLVFHKYWLPLLVKPSIHKAIFDLNEIGSAIWDGLAVQLAPSTFVFFAQQIGLNAADLPTRAHVVATIAIAVLALLVVYSQSSNASRMKVVDLLNICLGGLAVIILSYSIFSLNKEYHPLVASIHNRVNTGAAWGTALVVVSLLAALSQCIKAPQAVRSTLLAISWAAVLIFYASVDWCFERTWIASWRTQKNIQSIFQELKTPLRSGESVFLLNCPRYINWTPVFDGVWDFERMVQITTENPAICANVVSERLSITSTALTDTAHGYVVGRYPLSSVYTLAPDTRTLIKVRNAEAFIDEVEHNGMKFGLDPQQPARWRKELEK